MRMATKQLFLFFLVSIILYAAVSFFSVERQVAEVKNSLQYQQQEVDRLKEQNLDWAYRCQSIAQERESAALVRDRLGLVLPEDTVFIQIKN